MKMISVTMLVALALSSSDLQANSVSDFGKVYGHDGHDCWEQLSRSKWFDHYFTLKAGVKSRPKDNMTVRGLGRNPVVEGGLTLEDFIAAKYSDKAAQDKVYPALAVYYRGFEFDSRRTGGIPMEAVVRLICTAVFWPEQFEEVVIEKGDHWAGMIYLEKSSKTIVSGRFIRFALEEAEALKLSVEVDGMLLQMYILKDCGNAGWKYGTLEVIREGKKAPPPPAVPPTPPTSKDKEGGGYHVEVLTQQNWLNIPEVVGEDIRTGKIKHYRSFYGVRLSGNWTFLDESPNTYLLGAQLMVGKENINLPSELTVENPGDANLVQGLVRGKINNLTATATFTATDGPERKGESVGGGVHYNPFGWEAEATFQDTNEEVPGSTSDYQAIVARVGVKPFELIPALNYKRELWGINPSFGVAWSAEELTRDYDAGFMTRAEIESDPVRGYARLFKDFYQATGIDPETGKTIVRLAWYGFVDILYGNKEIKLFRKEGDGPWVLQGHIVAPQFDFVVETGLRFNVSELIRWRRIKKKERALQEMFRMGEEKEVGHVR